MYLAEEEVHEDREGPEDDIVDPGILFVHLLIDAVPLDGWWRDGHIDGPKSLWLDVEVSARPRLFSVAEGEMLCYDVDTQLVGH